MANGGRSFSCLLGRFSGRIRLATLNGWRQEAGNCPCGAQITHFMHPQPTTTAVIFRSRQLIDKGLWGKRASEQPVNRWCATSLCWPRTNPGLDWADHCNGPIACEAAKYYRHWCWTMSAFTCSDLIRLSAASDSKYLMYPRHPIGFNSIGLKFQSNWKRCCTPFDKPMNGHGNMQSDSWTRFSCLRVCRDKCMVTHK